MRQSAQLVANDAKGYDVAGNFFYLETLPAGLLSVRFIRGSSQLDEEIEATERGWQAAPAGGFDRIELTSSLTQVVVFHVVKGRVGVNVFSGTVTINKPSAIDTLADVNLGAGATSIVAADATRRAALLSNLVANVGNIRFGDAAVAANRGVETQPGQTVTLEGTEEIFAFGTAGDDVGITIIKD